MTSQEMMKTKLKPGMMWSNEAKLGEKPNWIQVPSRFGPHSDPNYGHGEIFGYDARDLMQKQYK